MRKIAETFRTLFELSPNGIALAEEDGTILMVNRAFAELFGYESPDVLSGASSRLFYMLPGAALSPLISHREGGDTVVKYDLPLLRKNGESFFAEVSSRKLRLGRKEYFLTHVHDVTLRMTLEQNLRTIIAQLQREKVAREKLAQELHEKNAQLEELSHMKDEFLAIASHDLRSPLTSISGYIGVLKENLTRKVLSAEEQSECLNGVVDSVKSLVRLIDAFLDLARFEAGRLTLNLHQEDFREIVQRARKVILPQASAKGIRIDVEVREPLPITVLDRDKILQVMDNLLTNAVKFTGDGGAIAVTVLDERGSLRVEVRDSGVGIAPGELETIFNKYEQAKKHTRGTRGERGTGLGLAICRNIVELHRGRIWAQNNPDGGSTFIFVLPGVTEEDAQV